MQSWQIITGSARETRHLGQLFGRLAEAGLVVLLSGQLGAGKTCFAQGVGSGLGLAPSSPVTSPSYTLLNIHQGRLPFYHFDLYRLTQVDDLADLGYDEYAEGDGLTMVEWADRMTGALSSSIDVAIESLGGEQRKIRFVARDDRGAELLGQLVQKWSGGDRPFC
ncbi:MAG: tRNA (adenosine(37)-N6)-threonylcarbamoyltransferase complex ATPase subunit type 1 TsaE [Desulfuromonadales bacterium]